MKLHLQVGGDPNKGGFFKDEKGERVWLYPEMIAVHRRKNGIDYYVFYPNRSPRHPGGWFPAKQFKKEDVIPS